MLILVETDTNLVTNDKDYTIAGFKTWLPLLSNNSEKTRLIMLTKLDKPRIKLREDLMSTSFPSIWIEEEIKNNKNIIIGGFYREWSTDGIVSAANQFKAVKSFATQLEAATRENKAVINIYIHSRLSRSFTARGFSC